MPSGSVEGAARLIHAHEVDRFPSPQTVRLERVAFLSTRCHRANHFERSGKYCRERYLRTLVDHDRRVNGGPLKRLSHAVTGSEEARSQE